MALVDGDLDDAIGHFREAVRLKPEFAAAHYSLGEALWRTGDKARLSCISARPCCSIPASAEARLTWAESSWSKVRTQEALVHCQEAVRLRPDMADAHNNLGNALQALGRLDEAKACLLESLRLDPDQTASHASLANVWEQLGEFDQAVDSLREVLQLRSSPCRRAGPARDTSREKLPETDQATIESLLARSPALARAPFTIAIRAGSGDRCPDRV